MKKNSISILLCFCFSLLWAQTDTIKYRVSLKDKAETTYSLDHPEAFLSPKALERRQRQQISVDSTDLPVCRTYINRLEQLGVRVVHTGKWENFVTVSCSDTLLKDRMMALPFVQSVVKVWTATETADFPMERDSLINQWVTTDGELYGTAAQQIRLSKGDKLHEAGFRGQGMTIAVIDAGFQNVDRMKVMDNVQIVGTHDFVSSTDLNYIASNHGTTVLSCMAMNKPYVMVGTAPEASYWLLRSEEEATEFLVEEDNWAAAVEFADSVGVDIINTSLGYYSFDDESMNYRLCDLNGRVSLMSRQASRLADKGILLVCSAGNSGLSVWKKITPPADARHILAVGAVDKQGVLATFSSVGNTSDGRVKPDVMAVGVAADVIYTNGIQSKANGTSYASPILCGMVACLWQACPTLTVKELITLVRSVGDRADCSDNIYGYGVPDLWKAYQQYLSTQSQH
ncbi:subtilisin-like serine protease [gut metagenome]|uniref:Subtilisin-like serine protease n=1 Tax=gut metagenome TaxID=749906 RepID=J9CML4_9ZZZZ